MDARKYLEQVEKIDNLIKNKKYDREQWLSVAQGTSVSSDGDRVQSSGELHKMENAVVKAVELDEAIKKLELQREEIISTIEKLDAEPYDILHQRYIQHIDLMEVGENLHVAWSTIKNKHRDALTQLQKILDEREL